MARPQKRPGDDSLRPDARPSKRKATGTAKQLNFAPQFYNSLSKIWLTSRALRELDRRNRLDPVPRARAPRDRIADLALAAKESGSQLARFARGGGPDLCDLRGCIDPSVTMSAMDVVSTAGPSEQPGASTKPTTVTAKTKRSSAYDANFEQHLIDHQIYPPLYRLPNGRRPPKPANWGDIREALRAPRGSLAPSEISDSAFEDFQLKNTTKSEGTLMRSVVPAIAGDSDIPNEGHLPFINLNSITNQITVNPVPDFFDGAYPSTVDKRVRDALNKIIVPTKHAHVPIAPNFFFEAKGPTGTGDVARGQAVLDGAHGAFMMHSLKNFGQENPIYDNNAYAFSATLLDGQLKLYAHHLEAPAEAGLGPDYYTTQLKAYALTGDDEVWLEGTGAFRNLRVLARDYREQFIAIANERARAGHQKDKSTVQACCNETAAHEACERPPGGPEVCVESNPASPPVPVPASAPVPPTPAAPAPALETNNDTANNNNNNNNRPGTTPPLQDSAPPKQARTPPSPSSDRQQKRRGPGV